MVTAIEIQTAYWLSIVGLGLDIFGVLLLFFYGVAAGLAGAHGDAITARATAKSKNEQARNTWRSRAGFLLLVAGFFIQAVGSYQQMNLSLQSL